MLNFIEDNTIVVVPNIIKNKVIESVRRNIGLKDIKFMSILEFQRQFYFTYDNKTIYYLMNKYHWKYEVCLVYLKNLYYVEDKKYNYEKLSFLNNLKQELDKENLLIYDNFFRKSLKNKNILVYGFDYLNLFYQKMFKEVSNITSVNILNKENNEYKHSYIYEFDTLEEEVNFVAIKIIELINNNVDINNIKLANVTKEYMYPIKKIFSFYHIPIYLEDNSSLYSSTIGKYFFICLDKDIQNTLDKVWKKYKMYSEEYNQIIDILNEYSWCKDFTLIKDMLIYEFKNTFIKKKKRNKEVSCIELKDNIINDDDYVFLMNFNQGNFPKIYLDEDYITDIMKKELDTLEDTILLNKIEKDNSINIIKGIKNLTISYKKESSSGSYIISNLNDELNFEIITDFQDSYCYSNLYNELRLAKDIDEFSKYGISSSRLPILFNHYKDIPYLEYDNKFTGIDKNKLVSFLNNELLLSYSTIDNFYRCGFRYYIGNILKLSIYEDTFMTTLGSLFHDVLSKAFSKEDFNLDKSYQDYIDNCGKEFSRKEKFFLNKLKGELKFIISSINKQMGYCSLDKAMYEEKIYIDKSDDMSITFMGIVDKIIYDEIDNGCYVSIIDYKTGNPHININNTIYGIEMQLPVYLYLVNRSGKFSKVKIAGFYLQKVLNSEILRDDKHTYEELKLNNLKLQGYSNDNVSILEKFDSNYFDSQVVKSLKVTNNGFASYSKVIDNDKIDKLIDVVDDKIDEAIADIKEAKFDINPKRIGKVNYGCEFCKFKDICFMKENDVVNLKEYKNLEFLGGDEE